MRISIWVVIILFVMLIGGCASPSRLDQPVSVNVIPLPEAGFGLTEVVRTTVSQEKLPEEEGTGHLPTIEPSLAYPVEQLLEATADIYPPPTEIGESGEDASIQPYQDCIRTPGLSDCGMASFALTGRLALSDRSDGRVIVLDLASGSGWQMASHPSALAWSPDSERLLLTHHTDGGEQYELWRADGKQLPSPALDSLVRWQPDGSLAPFDTARNNAGDQARLERSPEGRWLLRLRPVGIGESSQVISPQQADQIFVLLDWVPGAQQLLAQRVYASGAAVQSGGQLVTIDMQSGQVQDLDLIIASGAADNLAWNPAKLGLLAVRTTGAGAAGERGASPGLVLLDLTTGQRQYPLPPSLTIGGLAWNPNGQSLAFAVEAIQELSPSETNSVFNSPGIYLLDPQTGSVEKATQPPSGAVDGWPHWTTGGMLVYGRLDTADSSRPLAQVRALDPGTGQEVIFFQDLPVLPPGHAGMDWSAFLAFGE